MNYDLINQAPFLTAAGFDFGDGVGAYEGASHSRIEDVSDFGPEEAISADLDSLRPRSRHYVRNNAWAKNAVQQWVSAAVGTGITARWSTGDKNVNLLFEELWSEFIQECDFDEKLDFAGIQALVMGTVVNSGDCYVRRRVRPLEEDLAVPLQLQVIEPDFLAREKNEVLPSGGYIKNGKQYSKGGKLKYYHFHKYHPNESISFHDPEGTVKIRANDIIHVMKVERPGQSTGIPWVSSVLLRLSELDAYEDAELVRKKTAALFAAFIKEAQPTTNPMTPGVSIKTPNKTGKRSPLVQLKPGLMQRLGVGQEMQFSQPADVGTTYEPWLRFQLMAIAKGYGLSYEMLSGDLRGVSYSSIRAGLIDFRRLCEQVQHFMLKYQLCRKVSHWFCDIAFHANRLSVSDYELNRRKYRKIKWVMPRWDEVDPLKKLLADKGEVRSGFAPIKDKQQQRGHEQEDILENAGFFEVARKQGLSLDTDGSVTNNNGTEQRAMLEIANSE